MTEKLTPQQAKSFEHGESAQHALILAEVAQGRGCSCQAYVDWFTYNRWLAQGFQVQKGEKGTRLTVFVPIEKIDEATGQKKIAGTRPRSTTVFCRCQVKEAVRS